MTDFYSQNRCVCSTRSHGPLLCAFCLSFHFKGVGHLGHDEAMEAGVRSPTGALYYSRMSF